MGERYRLERLLGEGGMGQVWEAVHLVLNRHVAVKILKPRFAQQGEVLLRFRREAQVTAGLGHPKIVEVLDFVWGPGQPTYLVMELLQGQSLEAALGERGALAWPVALKVAVDVLDALGAAHAAGIVHRDMKPANIWLEGDLNEPRVKVLDFGVAQIADEGGPKLTRTNATVGTPRYLPPEQIAGSRVDGRADLWAMGVTLYETLAGRPPFAGADFAALVGAILTQEPPPLRSLVPEVPAPLAEAVAAALQKQPEGRPATAEAMAAPLRELLATLARQHGEDAFASTMELSSPPAPPAAVPALDSSPRLPGTRVQEPSAVVSSRADKKRRFGRAMMLNVEDLPAAPPLHALPGLADPALLELDEDEPPVLPTRSTGRWLLAGLVVTLLGAGLFGLFTFFGQRASTPAVAATALSPGPAPHEAEAGTAVGVRPLDEAPSSVEDAGPGPSTRALPPVATPEPAPPVATPEPAPEPSAPESSTPEPTAGLEAAAPRAGGAHMRSGLAPPSAEARHTEAPHRRAVTSTSQSPGSPGVSGNMDSRSSTDRATRLHRVAIGGSYDRGRAQAHVGAAEVAANRCVARTRPPVGTTRYRVEVPADGRVESVTGGDPGVRRCLARAFRMIRWNPPAGGAPQSLTLTYEALP